ncbi:hypothetical protein FBU30_010083 [Linnemannia zychae]|nr:hypothetical protein FBU30_010083 [Linnemannia zychae]
MSAADIWTPLYGFVFHMEPTLLVPPNILPVPQSTLSVGEWNSLQYSNNLLSRQFGPRHRSYLAHVPHVLCAPMLQEIQSLWPEEFSKTSSHRFRGEGSAEDIQVSFFMAHYVIERLRETQLESFWNYRLDANMDGVLDWSERATFINRVRVWNEKQAQLAELLSGPKAYTYVSEFNSSLKNYEVNLARLGYQSSESSFYQLSGLDGYPFMIQPNNPNHVDDMTRNSMNDNNNANNNDKNNNNKPFLPFISVDTRYCQINIDFCFGSKFLDPNISTIDKSTSSEIFESIAFSKFQCGDCLLHMLRQYGSSSGLGAEILPLDTQSQAFQSVIADMAKYNFVIATSAYSFVQLFEPRDASNKLDTIIQRETIEAFFCINDNAGENPATVDQIRKVFAEFLDTRFPTSSPWEKTDWPIVSG